MSLSQQARSRWDSSKEQSKTSGSRLHTNRGTKQDAGTVASGHRRSDASCRLGSLLDSNRTLALSCPVISPARLVIVLLCAAQADQRVRSFTGPARLVDAMSVSGRCFVVSRWATGTSGQLDQRVRSVLRDLAIVRPARPVSMTSASGQCDQHVRSSRFRLFKFLTALFEEVRL
jgi:hypothetical protein